MRYNFSSNFLKILPPDSNFGEAWESLCYTLLCAENGHKGFTRLNPPDRGIDIFHQVEKRAYQCKSHENGAAGTLEVTESINSLKTALKHRDNFDWGPYCFATNANFSGVGFEKLMSAAKELGLDKSQIEHLGPEYWDNLCIKHSSTVKERFDYRFSATEEQVIEAFKKANYFDKYIATYEEEIKKTDFSLVITNNRTPVEIAIPFSPELSVENYLDVAKGLLGISLDWTNFEDLNTSAGPSISVTIDQKAQPFSTKIKELPLNKGDKLELWIKIVWRDELKKDGSKDENTLSLYRYLEWGKSYNQTAKTPQEKRELTVSRKEAIIQSKIWDGVLSLITSA